VGFDGFYGPNDDHLQCALFEELLLFMSSWDISWCLGADFNVIRFPSERSMGARLTWAMRDFSVFINSCNLIDPPLEGAHFTWSSHEEVPDFQCYRALTDFFIRLSGKITSKGFIK